LSLDEPGQPATIVIDGVAYRRERTKRDVCGELHDQVGGDYPTGDEPARVGLTRADYETFLIELLDEEDDTRAPAVPRPSLATSG
jgi:hypothetical protein